MALAKLTRETAVAFTKTSGTVLNSGILTPGQALVHDGYRLVVVVGMDNLSASTPQVSDVVVHYAEGDVTYTPGTAGVCFALQSPAGTTGAAAGVKTSIIVIALDEGKSFSGGDIGYTVNLTAAVSAKVTWGSLYTDIDMTNIANIQNVGSAAAHSLAAPAAGKMRVWSIASESGTPVTMGGVGSNHSAASSGGSSATNVALRIASAWTSSVGTSTAGTDGSACCIEFTEKASAPPMTPAWAGFGIPA